MEKYGVEVTKEKKPGEKIAQEECTHKVIRAEGEGAQRVYFCMQCNKYINGKEPKPS